jgi:hypothetical protein
MADKKPELPPLQLLSWGQIVISAVEEYLVQGIMPAAGLIVVYGPPKCGKTFWLFDLLMSVALGIPYRGRDVQAGKVIYCLFEGQLGFAKRKEAYRQYHQLSDDTDEPPFYLMPIKLELVKDHQRLIDAIKAKTNGTPPRVIVLDTLNRSFTGSESSDEAMTAYIAACDAIREAFGCAVIIVHHSGLAEGRARGHTSLLGSCDAQIAVRRDEVNNVVATVEFMKDGEDGDELVSHLEPFEVEVGDTGRTVKSCVVVPVDGPAIRASKKQTRGRQAIDEAFNEIASRGSMKHFVRLDGPECEAVRLEDVEQEFKRRYPTDKGDDKQKAAARKKAWQRARAEALKTGGGYGYEERSGLQLIWRI